MTPNSFLKLIESQIVAGEIHKPGKRLRKGSLESFQKKRSGQAVPPDLVALYEDHNGFDLMKKSPTQLGSLQLYPMSKWKSARGWWNYRGGGDLENPAVLDGTIIGQHMTKSSPTTWLQSQIVLDADGSQFHLLAWGAPCYEIGSSTEELLDWLAEKLS